MKRIAFLLTVIAVAFPPFETSESFLVGWKFIGSLHPNEGLSHIVCGLELGLIWGWYFRSSFKGDEKRTEQNEK